jgi:30S ribosomal protein S31
MGKGDKKTKRGKIFSGSYGKTRLRKKSSNRTEIVTAIMENKAAAKSEEKAEKKTTKAKSTTKKKTATKSTKAKSTAKKKKKEE